MTQSDLRSDRGVERFVRLSRDGDTLFLSAKSSDQVTEALTWERIPISH